MAYGTLTTPSFPSDGSLGAYVHIMELLSSFSSKIFSGRVRIFGIFGIFGRSERFLGFLEDLKDFSREIMIGRENASPIIPTHKWKIYNNSRPLRFFKLAISHTKVVDN